MSVPRMVGDDHYSGYLHTDTAIHLDPDAAIRVALPYTTPGGAMPFVVRLGAGVSIHTGRAQVAHLRDVLTAALDATEDGDTE